MAPSTEFTQERLLALAPQKQLVISFTNRVRIDFARTWAFHARAAGVAAFLIGATDRHALSELQHMVRRWTFTNWSKERVRSQLYVALSGSGSDSWPLAITYARLAVNRSGFIACIDIAEQLSMAKGC
eukprot:6185801-Pleurochrysis_carterae.AAC.2